MAGGVFLMEPGTSSRRGRSSRGASAGRSDRGVGWVPVALGLTALAGVTAVAVRNAYGGHIDRRYEKSRRRKSTHPGEPKVERSITIGKSADELYGRLRDPTTLPRIMARFATVKPTGDGRMHWTVKGRLGRTYEWETEPVNDAGRGFGWRALPGAGIPNEGSVRFSPAPADRGTVVTLRLSFDPPNGVLGEAATRLLGSRPLDLAVDGALRRFQSLAETGEIPTTERQPAARADTR